MKTVKQRYEKLISLILTFTLVFSVFSIMPLSASAAIGDIFTADGLTYTVTDEVYGSYSVSVTGFDNSTNDVVIPEKVANNGIEYAVTSIDKTVFQGNTEITSVNIPGTVIKTSPSCFKNCSSLKNIILNEGIEDIVAGTFQGTAVEEIKFPKSLKIIRKYALNGCQNLKNVYFNSDVNISTSVFYNSSSIENVYCYGRNTIFDKNAFNNINGFILHGYAGSTAETFAKEKGYNFVEIIEESTTEPTTVTEPEPSTEPDTSIFNWRKINNDTAVEITGIKDEYKMQANVDISSEINGLPVTSIGASAFEGGQVMYLTIPSSVFVINDSAFKNCSNLTTITFAENSQLQKIGNEAFYRNQGAGDKINSVDLPESLNLIGYRAFYNRANLLAVKVYSRDVYFGDAAKGKEVFDLYTGTSNLKLYGYTGSTTETYAAENGHAFRYLDLNTDKLQALYDKAEAIDSNLYTEESYSNLLTAMKAAKRMIANKDATPAQIEQCINDLQAAIDNLEIYVEPTSTEPTTAPIEYVEFILGNVNGADSISVTDATIIQKHIVELLALSGTDLFAADVNGDGIVSVIDVTILQSWLAKSKNAMNYNIGKLVKKEISPTQPTDPDPSTNTFYLPNYVSWLTDMGGKMWVYNDTTTEFMVMKYDEETNCFYTELSDSWSELSFYRTPFETTEEDFDINNPWSDETQSGVILNKWEHLGDRGKYNCYKITGDGEGMYTTYDPNVEPDDERTIYFDNSKTKWSNVYIYGWSFGISNEFIQMEPEGNDIWSYTFYDDLPIDGVKGFLFVNSTSWSGATQTVDLATEEGKNLFVPATGGNKISGKWDVYTQGK